jgi:hypothetical protein
MENAITSHVLTMMSLIEVSLLIAICTLLVILFGAMARKFLA